MSAELTNKDRRLLRSLVPLHLLSDERFQELTAGTPVEQLGRGEVLFQQGDEDHNSLYLLDGQLALLSGERVVEQVAAGSNTARFPIAHQTPRKFTARAVAPARVVRIDSQRLSAILGQDHTSDYQVSDLNEDGGEEDWMTQLLQSKVLQQIPAANIQRVMLRVERLEVKAGESIIRQGESGDYYYMLNRGQAVVSRDQGHGKPPIELARVGAGTSFGEEALLSDSPRNSTITMLTDGILLRLSKQDFVELVHQPLSNTLDFAAASALVAEGAVWLDVRLPEEFASGHLPGSLNLPFDVLRYQTDTLADDRRYIVVSGRGGSAAAAAFLLTEHGFESSVLDGGYAGVAPLVPPQPDKSDRRSVATSSANAARERALEQRIGTLQAERQTLERQLREAIETARERLQVAEQARQVAIAERDDARAERTKLAGRLEVGELDREGMRQRLTEAEEREAALKERLRKAESYGIAERDRAESASQRYDDLARQLDSLRADRALERAANDQSVGALKEQLTELQLALEQSRSDLEEAHSRSAAGVTELAVAQQQLAALDGVKKDLELRQAQAEARARELGEQLDELRRSTGDGDTVREQLATQLHAAESRAATLAQELAAQVEEAVRLREATAAAEQARAELQEELAAARAQLAALEERVAAQDGATRDLAAQLQGAAAKALQLEEVTAALAERDERIAALEAARAATQERLAQLTANQEDEQQQQQTRLADLESQLKANAESRKRAERERDTLQQDLKARTEGLKGLQSALEEQRARFQRLDAELQQARAGHAARQEETAARLLELGERLEVVEAQRAAAVAQLEARQNGVDALRAAERALSDAQVDAEARATELTQQLALLTADAADLGTERDRLQDALAQARSESAALTARCAAAEHDQASQGERLTETTAALVALQAQSAAAAAAQEQQLARIATLERDLAVAIGRGAGLDAEVQSLAGERDAAHAELERLRAALAHEQAGRAEPESMAQEALARAATAEAELQEVQQRLVAATAAAEALAGARDELASQRARLDQSADAAAALRDTVAAQAERLQQQAEALARAQTELAGAQAAQHAESADRSDAARAQGDLLQERSAELAQAQAELSELQGRLARLEAVSEDSALLYVQRQAAEESLREQLRVLTVERDALAAAAASETSTADASAAVQTLSRERDLARAEVVRLRAEGEELRDVMARYAEQIRAAQSAAEDIESLNSELAMVRQLAVDDAARLREELASAQAQRDAAQQEAARAPVQQEALRQELGGLREALEQRERELAAAAQDRHRIEAQLEQAGSELEVLRQAARSPADAVPGSTDGLAGVSRDAAAGDPADDLLDEGLLRDHRIRPPRRALDIGKVTGDAGRTGSLLLGLVVGLVLVIGALELATLLSGRGELFKYLFGAGG